MQGDGKIISNTHPSLARIFTAITFAPLATPYFLDATDRAAMEADEPVPVLTCWNGIVAFAADPLLPVHLRRNHTLSHKALGVAPPARHPLASVAEKASSPALTPPLRFRASAEGECFSSESFLLPYDFRRIMGLETLKAKTRERFQPKMGKVDIDYQKLHDAFFKFMTKPNVTFFGEMCVSRMCGVYHVAHSVVLCLGTMKEKSSRRS